MHCILERLIQDKHANKNRAKLKLSLQASHQLSWKTLMKLNKIILMTEIFSNILICVQQQIWYISKWKEPLTLYNKPLRRRNFILIHLFIFSRKKKNHPLILLYVHDAWGKYQVISCCGLQDNSEIEWEETTNHEMSILLILLEDIFSRVIDYVYKISFTHVQALDVIANKIWSMSKDEITFAWIQQPEIKSTICMRPKGWVSSFIMPNTT